MALRFATLADRQDLIERIAAWHVREWGEMGSEGEEWAEILRQRSNRESIPFTVLAFSAEELVGSVSVTWDDLDDDFSDEGPWLSGMIVQGPARNAGIGRELLGEVERRCRDLGHETLWLHTAEAHRFYERCGWTVVRPRLTIGEDTVMRRHLGS